MAERILQLEEGLAAQYALYARLSRSQGVSVDDYHPLLQEGYTKIKYLAQNKSLEGILQVDPITQEECTTHAGSIIGPSS